MEVPLLYDKSRYYFIENINFFHDFILVKFV